MTKPTEIRDILYLAIGTVVLSFDDPRHPPPELPNGGTCTLYRHFPRVHGRRWLSAMQPLRNFIYAHLSKDRLFRTQSSARLAVRLLS